MSVNDGDIVPDPDTSIEYHNLESDTAGKLLIDTKVVTVLVDTFRYRTRD